MDNKPYRFGENSYPTLADARKGVEEYLKWALIDISADEVHAPQKQWAVKITVELVPQE